MTESSPVSHVQPQENAVLGGCGHPVPNTIAKIVDITTGAALGPNEDGELCVAGPQVLSFGDLHLPFRLILAAVKKSQILQNMHSVKSDLIWLQK